MNYEALISLAVYFVLMLAIGGITVVDIILAETISSPIQRLTTVLMSPCPIRS